MNTTQSESSDTVTHTLDHTNTNTQLEGKAKANRAQDLYHKGKTNYKARPNKKSNKPNQTSTSPSDIESISRKLQDTFLENNRESTTLIHSKTPIEDAFVHAQDNVSKQNKAKKPWKLPRQDRAKPYISQIFYRLKSAGPSFPAFRHSILPLHFIEKQAYLLYIKENQTSVRKFKTQLTYNPKSYIARIQGEINRLNRSPRSKRALALWRQIKSQTHIGTVNYNKFQSYDPGYWLARLDFEDRISRDLARHQAQRDNTDVLIAERKRQQAISSKQINQQRRLNKTPIPEISLPIHKSVKTSSAPKKPACPRIAPQKQTRPSDLKTKNSPKTETKPSQKKTSQTKKKKPQAPSKETLETVQEGTQGGNTSSGTELCVPTASQTDLPEEPQGETSHTTLPQNSGTIFLDLLQLQVEAGEIAIKYQTVTKESFPALKQLYDHTLIWATQQTEQILAEKALTTYSQLLAQAGITDDEVHSLPKKAFDIDLQDHQEESTEAEPTQNPCVTHTTVGQLTKIAREFRAKLFWILQVQAIARPPYDPEAESDFVILKEIFLQKVDKYEDNYRSLVISTPDDELKSSIDTTFVFPVLSLYSSNQQLAYTRYLCDEILRQTCLPYSGSLLYIQDKYLALIQEDRKLFPHPADARETNCKSEPQRTPELPFQLDSSFKLEPTEQQEPEHSELQQEESTESTSAPPPHFNLILSHNIHLAAPNCLDFATKYQQRTESRLIRAKLLWSLEVDKYRSGNYTTEEIPVRVQVADQISYLAIVIDKEQEYIYNIRNYPQEKFLTTPSSYGFAYQLDFSYQTTPCTQVLARYYSDELLRKSIYPEGPQLAYDGTWFQQLVDEDRKLFDQDFTSYHDTVDNTDPSLNLGPATASA